MKKITLFLSVLLMAIVVKAQSEAAAVVKMTWVDYDNSTTAIGEVAAGETARAGYNKISVSESGSEVAFPRTDWGENKITYIQVDASSYTGKIIDATLTVEVSGSSDGKRTTSWGVGYNSSVWSADMTYDTADKTITTMGDVQSTSTKSSTTFETKTFDILGAFENDANSDKIVTLVVYETAAAGGYIKNPQVEIEAVDASTATTYTVKYVDEEGNEIATAKEYNISIGETASIADENKVAIWNADKTMKYIYKSCDKESITTVADATANVITATFREAKNCSYTVNAVDGDGNVLKTLATGTSLEGESVITPYNQYVLNGGVLYEASATNKEYNKSNTISSDDTIIKISYSVSKKNNTVCFIEAEDITGMTTTTKEQAGVRASNAMGAYNASEIPVEVLTLTPGTYTITTQFVGGSNSDDSKNVDLTIMCGDESLVVRTTGSRTDKSGEFTITKNAKVSIPKCGTSNKCLDWILIQSAEANSLLAVVDGQDFTAAEGTYAAATYTRTVNPAYNYGTICLPFVPNAATLENYTFYGFTATSDGAVTFTEVETPEAYMPYLYSAKDKSATTHTFIGDETEVVSEYEYVNYADVENWEFYGNLEEWYVPDLSEMTAMGTLQYAYKPTDEGEDVLVKATKSLRAKPYRAYFICYQSFGGWEPLATMRIIVRGAGDMGDGTTGIEEVITPDQIEGAAPAIYNLMGQPVAQPVKGQIYIVNGKKVVY